ncbi:CatA-like O-acetyltransferase [Indioceanicola profundi]|uniref:CatA-like O-acetyltransferase n=1 Tax=Indioceanicola profundi TaxID=2220096 RepID=UPI000E6AA58A|nr:CatA-like O-acetyltransferase [Indioceanicola profundi]
MIDRQAQIALFGTYDQPAVNITAEAECIDFTAPAKAAGIPPFALLLHGIGRASMEVENFRLRLLDGKVSRVERLRLSYTVLGRGENLNFSTLDHTDDFDAYLAAYLADRELARDAVELRLTPLTDRDYLFVTCLPWLRFTAIQHPMARFGDCSIPNIAVGKFAHADGRLRFPIAVQAHHGLVDGLHIHRFIARLEEIMGELAAMAAARRPASAAMLEGTS